MGDSWGVIATGFGKGINKSASDARNGATKSDFNPKILGLNKSSKKVQQKTHGGFLMVSLPELGDLEKSSPHWLRNQVPIFALGTAARCLRRCLRFSEWASEKRQENGPLEFTLW
jgi:hypothetical protein